MDNNYHDTSQTSVQAQKKQEDPGFISNQLVHKIFKAQESLLFVLLYHSASKNKDTTSPLGKTTAETHTDLSMRNNATIEIFSDEVNKSSNNTVKSPLKESLQQSFKAFFDGSPVSITPTATINISTSTNIASTSGYLQSPKPHLSSTTAPQLQLASQFSQQQEQSPSFLTPSSELVFASGFSQQYKQSPMVQTPSNYTIQRQSTQAQHLRFPPMNLKEHSTIQMNKSDLEKKAWNLIQQPSNTETPNSQDATDNHSDLSDILAGTKIQMKESDPDKKPLLASSPLPVYSKLIAALEEARILVYLTTIMACNLHNLTMTCKRTGNASIPSASHIAPQTKIGAKQVGNSDGVKVLTNTPSHQLELKDEEIEDQRPTKNLTFTPTNSTELHPLMNINSLPGDLTTTQQFKENLNETLEVEEEVHQDQSTNLDQQVDNSNANADPHLSKQSHASMTEANHLDSQSIQSQQSKKKSNPIHSSPAKSQKTINKEKEKKRCRGGAGEGKDEDPKSNQDTRTEKRKTVDDGALASDLIEGGMDSVMVKTKYNGQTWCKAIEETRFLRNIKNLFYFSFDFIQEISQHITNTKKKRREKVKNSNSI
ncbi:hypothetical protein DFH28DRAFT_1189632 [Melampsora americana]|nr:hypothetical protein DFH28DRAFT_1189632 [Melampsora americana]